MSEMPRLNGVIKALEEGQTAFVGFTPVDIESAAALTGSAYDGIAFEMEHAPLSTPALRDALQYMLDRRQILERGTLAPKVTPLVRIPPNGGEMNQWIAKQVLDIGVFGIIFPHVSTVEEARNAVSACRHPPSTTHQASAAMPPPARRGTGGCRSRSTTPRPMCGPSRRRGKSW
jgi:4-hydroxy-2-oxoheptanedioate aldolase